MSVAAENSSDSTLELPHKVVAAESLCCLKVYQNIIIVGRVLELDEESTLSFFQENADKQTLFVDFFFCQTITECTSRLYLGDIDHFDSAVVE